MEVLLVLKRSSFEKKSQMLKTEKSIMLTKGVLESGSQHAKNNGPTV